MEGEGRERRDTGEREGSRRWRKKERKERGPK